MTPVAQSLAWGLPILAVVLPLAYFHKRAWLRPPRNDRAARFREHWTANPLLGYLGIRIRDGFVYEMAGHILGPLDGAAATVEPWDDRVVKVKPTLGWATITFADGTVHRHAFPMLRMAEAKTQLARFQALATATPPGAFARTRPAHLAP